MSTNQTVLEFMRTRRSVPAKMMAGPGPDAQELRSMLEIASRVPDHGKLAPWRFILYSQGACIRIGEALADNAKAQAQKSGKPYNSEIEELEKQRLLRAPSVVAVVSNVIKDHKIPVWEQQLSAGAVCMNLLIAANAHGFDAQWITEWYAFDEGLKPLFGLEGNEKIAGFIHIGTKQAPKTERDRPQLDNLITQLK